MAEPITHAERARMLVSIDRITEICEWCKQPVRIMCQKGTGVCSQRCAKLAADILFDRQAKAEKFGGGYSA